MDKGGICIPVCAPTADAMIEQIRRAEAWADIIEIRFDCLVSPADIDILQKRLSTETFSKPFLATYRSPEQGGRSRLTREQRIAFWTSLDSKLFELIDLEEDVIGWAVGRPGTIASYHDFEGVPNEIEDIFARLGGRDPSIVKVAAAAADVADAIPLWRLMDIAEQTGKQIIPVAMREPGKWTRILGIAHGAYLTYASLEEGSETAEGQITAGDMVDVYRVRDLTPETRVYGVIGDPVSSSLSPYMHNAAFVAAGLDAVFIHLQVKDLDTFISRMVMPASREVELNLGGFSVTMPHKRSVMRYLDKIDDTARQIGAVNTVKIEDGRLTGYNTDAHGFIAPLKKQYGDLNGSRVGILGAGGAARACVYALKAEGADVVVFVRSVDKSGRFGEEFRVEVKPIAHLRSDISDPRPEMSDLDILVNATPAGMKGSQQNTTLLTGNDLSGIKFVYDLVTRKDETPLLREARAAGVKTMGGLEMLIAQGARQFEIWTGRQAPLHQMRAAVESRMNP